MTNTQDLPASQCNCEDKVPFNNNTFMICKEASKWVELCQEYSCRSQDYRTFQKLYLKMNSKESKQADEAAIKKDLSRTFPQSLAYFREGQPGIEQLCRILVNLCKLPSSLGYIQGMNTIAGTLLYHTDEVMAFGLIDMICNDYNLKSVYMSGFPGLYLQCKIIECIIKEEKPNID